ncbi:MAG: glycine zipper 2TM domain-containing protein [Pseudomonadota bacterium]
MTTKARQRVTGALPLLGALALSAALVSAPALADPVRSSHYSRGHASYDYARVVDVEPIVRYVQVQTPVRECWEETRYREYGPRRDHGNVGGAIVGGLIGGVIGHQFGSGRGNDAMTVLGTLVGAAAGSDAKRHGHREDELSIESYPVQRCDVRYETHQEERIDGYHVTYVYNGQRLTTRTNYDPGERIRVRVSVRPAG